MTTLLSFIFALGVIIFVHEFGHLVVAKWFNVRVDAFSLGFGPRLWGFRRGETEYRVSAVPLGGYVKLGGELPDETEGDPREFLSKPRWQRILVYLAGPAMNVLLAIALIAGVFMVGTEVPDLPDMPPVIGSVEEGSPAETAGLLPGDRVTTIGGSRVKAWPDVAFALMTSPGKEQEITVLRGDQTVTATIASAPREDADEGIGDFAGLFPETLPSVIAVNKDSPAEAAGLKFGDQMRSIDGLAVTNTPDFIDYVRKHPAEEVVLGVVRGSQRIDIPVVPKDLDGIGQIGVTLGFYQRYGPVQAVVQSARYNYQLVKQTFIVLKKIFTGDIKAKSALAGPLAIAVETGRAAERGIKYLIHLMGFISISIAIVNLLPIPILDGGQITILLIESTMRRDLSLRVKEIVAQTGFVMIILLMLTVIYFDVSNTFF